MQGHEINLFNEAAKNVPLRQNTFASEDMNRMQQMPNDASSYANKSLKKIGSMYLRGS